MRKAQNRFDSETQKNIDSWLEGGYDEETKQQVRDLIARHPEEAVDAFYTTLTFGTGGLRGIMGVGSNRINAYTIRQATQGLANYIQTHREEGKNGVFIGYDSRHNSKQLAAETAKVLAANGIQVFLSKEMRPVPYISFACRHRKCQAAIVITASHNPPAYNGYKVYWSDGGQVVPPHDKGIMAEVQKIHNLSMVRCAPSLEHPNITWDEVDSAYLEALSSLQLYPQETNREIKITYTSLHGTGITLMPRAFAAWGFPSLSLVAEQSIPDGDFPTVSSPNPEEESSLVMGMEQMRREESDLLIATDPDADRLGVVVNHRGKPVRLSGNQIACLCLEHVCRAQKLPKKAACIKTIVTTELFQAIADAHQIPCFNVLTGFKYIAATIHEWDLNGAHQFIFGGEESYGYLLGTHARDKDALISAVLIAEAALFAKRQGKTLVDQLHELYQKYGCFGEKVEALTFPETKEGREKIAKGIAKLQHSPPQKIGHCRVEWIEDYYRSLRINLATGETRALSLPKSQMVAFWLEGGSKVVVRPSGTEPKIKFYGSVNSKTATLLECEQQASALIEALKALI